ncbi:MAG: hypothetical protein EBR02_05805 [Alphaproteobacteria bacterium]|nr:hypothetical protein [Alphaproteobacteria bacterium]
MQAQPKQFENLTIPRKSLPLAGGCRYRVYETAQNFKIVDAATAMEALSACGLTYAYKILRDDPMNENLLSHDAWAKDVLLGGDTGQNPSAEPEKMAIEIDTPPKD